MERKSYCWCAVPQCRNTSITTPNKLFINVPRKADRRKKWLELARRKYDAISINSSIYFCEDHFNIQKDMTNYIQYKMGFSRKIRMADGVLPSKFHCQKGYRNKQRDNDRKKLNITSPEELELSQTGETGETTVETEIEIKIEKLDEETLIVPEMLTNSEDNVNEVVLKAIKLECPWQTSDKETLTDPVATDSKHVQKTHHVHFRSKAVQKKIETRDVSVSPIDIPTKISYDYIQSRSKSIIYKMYKYLVQEYRQMNKMYQGKLDLTPLSKVKKRMAEATGLSQEDLKRILEEETERTKSCKAPPRKRRRIYRKKKYCVHKCLECEGGARAVNNDHNYNSREPKTEQNKAITPDSQSQDSANEADVKIKVEGYIQYNENEIHNSTCKEDPSLTDNIIIKEEKERNLYI